MGISSSGLISSINSSELISQLMEIERQPIKRLQARQKEYQTKIASVLEIKTKLNSFMSALSTLNNAEKFNTKTASVTKTTSGDNLLTVSPSNNASEGSYTIEVDQLAKANKKASQGWSDYNTTAIASGGGTFKFKVGSGGAESLISVNNTMTLQGLRDAINSTNNNVVASIVNDGTGANPYRLVLTANVTGSSNTIYITQNDTNLDFANKKVEAAYSYTSNSYSGVAASNEGNNYTGTVNKTYLLQVVTGGTPGSGTAQYKYSTDGGITWYGAGGAVYNGSNGVAVVADDTFQNIDGLADGVTTTEGVKTKFTGGTLAVNDKFAIDVFNPEMEAAKDAVLKVDNNVLIKSSNTITDAIQGVTLNLLKADESEQVTLTVSRDTTSASSSIQSFVTAYNTVMDFLNTQLSYDPDTKVKKPLLGDATIMEIRRKIANTVTGRIPGLSTAGYTNLSQIGITSDSKTAKLILDNTKLSAALAAKPDDVAKLFIGTATQTNQAVSFISKTSNTQPGKYSVYVATAPEKAVVAGTDRIDLSSNGLTADETLTFLFSKNKTSSTPDYDSLNITLSAGSTTNTIVNNLNSAFATKGVGLIASNDNGKIKIISSDYGADLWFQVTTNQQGDGITTYQIWNSVGTRSGQGVDIVGSINNHNAVGLGNMLTSMSGFEEEGLKISIDSAQTGGFGTITISSGIADKLPASIASYTDSTSGVLTSKEDSIQKTIDNLVAQQERLEERLTRKETQLKEKFVRLESILAKLDTTSQYLTSQMANLPKIGSK